MESSASNTKLEGIAAARAGETDEARTLLRRATELAPGDVEAWIWRASVATGDADRKSFLEEALRLEPGNAEARRALDRILEREGPLAARADEEAPTFCAVHPDRETMLRCNRCGRLMCTECAMRHPVGLRCRECVSQTKSPIYQVAGGTLALAFLVATLIAIPVGGLVITFGRVIWFLFWFFIGGALGAAIAGGVQRAVPRKRGRAMQGAVGAGILAGTLLAALGVALFAAGSLAAAIPLLLQLHVLLYLGLAIAGAVAAMR